MLVILPRLAQAQLAIDRRAYLIEAERPVSVSSDGGETALFSVPQVYGCRVTLGLLPVSLASGFPLFASKVVEPCGPLRVMVTAWMFQLSSVSKIPL